MYLLLSLIVDEHIGIFRFFLEFKLILLNSIHLSHSVEKNRDSFWRHISIKDLHRNGSRLERRLICVRLFFEGYYVRIKVISRSWILIFFIDETLEVWMRRRYGDLSKREVSDVNWRSISKVCKGIWSQFWNVNVLWFHWIPHINVLCFI